MGYSTRHPKIEVEATLIILGVHTKHLTHYCSEDSRAHSTGHTTPLPSLLPYYYVD